MNLPLRRTSWTDDLPPCPRTGVAVKDNGRYLADGGEVRERVLEDRHLNICFEGRTYIYGVFDGHDGSGRAADYAHDKFPAELLLERLPRAMKGDDAGVRHAIQASFATVERGFFESISDALAIRANIQAQLPPGLTDYQVYQHYPRHAAELESINELISGGSTATVALLQDDQLYVANVGDSRAVLCTCNPTLTRQFQTDSGDISPTLESLIVHQLTIDHDTDNPSELQRLASLGLDTEKIKKEGRLGSHQNTRSIGDYSMKGGYKDVAVVAEAKGEPVIAEPYVYPGAPVGSNWLFMFLMSDGVYRAVEEAHPTVSPADANLVVAQYISNEFRHAPSMQMVAEGALTRILQAHHKAFREGDARQQTHCRKHDDCTLIVRRFHHAMSVQTLSLPTPPATDSDKGLSSSSGDTTPAINAVSERNPFIPEPARPSNPSETKNATDSAKKTEEVEKETEEKDGDESVSLYVSFDGVSLPRDFPEHLRFQPQKK